jgi:AcrR family transcriptional regulator
MADDPTTQPGSPRARRRGAALEQAILRAAVDELIEAGYPGLTMDRVAKRAGTNKNTIYRRWPNRAALGVAAYRQLVEGELRLPDTGELRGDVLELLRRINCDLSSPRGEILRGLLASVSDEPELLAELHEQVSDGGSGRWLMVLGRAVARGEAAPEALHPRVATAALVLLRNEYITRGIRSVPDSVIIEIVDEVYLPLVRGRGSIPG